MKGHTSAHSVIIHPSKAKPIKTISYIGIQAKQDPKLMSLPAVNVRTKRSNLNHISVILEKNIPRVNIILNLTISIMNSLISNSIEQ